MRWNSNESQKRDRDRKIKIEMGVRNQGCTQHVRKSIKLCLVLPPCPGIMESKSLMA